MDDTAIDWLTDLALRALAQNRSISPAATTLLLRRYVTTGRADVSEALGRVLESALEESCSERDSTRRSEWLALFVEASAISDDDRLGPAIDALVTTIHRGWPSRGDVISAMRSVDACLAAGASGNTVDRIPAAIDELERIVGLTYQPGEGILGTLNQRSGEPGTLGDHISAASALASAYLVTGRLPYSMLAEELMQFVRRSWWDAARGGFHRRVHADRSTTNVERSTPNVERSTQNDAFVANCEAARVLCRLAALHRDQDYRRAAVIAEQSDYADDARRTLESLADEYREVGPDAAVYGLALTDYEALG